jgi:hypothetical protein
MGGQVGNDIGGFTPVVRLSKEVAVGNPAGAGSAILILAISPCF